jgi:putative transposase
MISKSSFYEWKRNITYVLSEQKQALKEQVKDVFGEHRRRYGARRIAAELQERGLKIGRHQVRTLMKSQDLIAIQPKSFVPKTTNSKHHFGRSPNLLLNEDGTYKKATRPYEIIVSDITYIAIRGGEFLYLATFQDAYTRVIVGWELMDTMNTTLIINALNKGINRKPFPKSMIIHSDGGGQYAADRFKQLLRAHDFKSSMTRKDNHYDNAMGESLFSRFKAELIQKGIFETFEDAYTEIFEYIEVYYNKKRRHSGLNNDFPERFEQKCIKNSHLDK